jgi:hypothetical protein
MNTITKSFVAAAVLAIGTTNSVFAQTTNTTNAPVETTTMAPSPNAPGAPAYGLLGSRYIGLDYGYLRYEEPHAPRSGHEFEAYYNQPLHPGLDLTARFLDSSTGYFGTRQRNDEVLAGLTAFQPVNNWVKPFISGEAGVAFSRNAELLSTGGLFRRHGGTEFDYLLAAGAEFQVAPAFVATPFLSYQEIHEVRRDWNYGVKLSYRFTPRWSATFTPSIDQHEMAGYKLGVNLHF